MIVPKLVREQVLIKRILDYLALPNHLFFLNGSGALALHGVEREREMGDLDVFMATSVWFECFEGLLSPDPDSTWHLVLPDPRNPTRRCDPPIIRGVLHGLTVDLFLNWRRRTSGNFDPALYLNNLQYPSGDLYPCAPLEFILDWKLGQGRNKDLLDVVSIRQFLGIEGNIED